MYSRIHEELLILDFENARGPAPRVLKEKNQPFRVYSVTNMQSNKIVFNLAHKQIDRVICKAYK